MRWAGLYNVFLSQRKIFGTKFGSFCTIQKKFEQNWVKSSIAVRVYFWEFFENLDFPNSLLAPLCIVSGYQTPSNVTIWVMRNSDLEKQEENRRQGFAKKLAPFKAGPLPFSESSQKLPFWERSQKRPKKACLWYRAINPFNCSQVGVFASCVLWSFLLNSLFAKRLAS